MEKKRFSEYTIEEQKELMHHWWYYYGKLPISFLEMEKFGKLLDSDIEFVKNAALMAWARSSASQDLVRAMRGDFESFKKHVVALAETEEFKKVEEFLEDTFISEMVISNAEGLNAAFMSNKNKAPLTSELGEPGEERILVKGGRGGLGNNNFKSATNQTPRYSQPGEPLEEGWFILELKLLADVGLVGFPNAGKSTLLSTVSAAKPKIGDYLFTTLEPNLGIVTYHDKKSFVMADIPGIIEGAHEGKGLGLRFLRHIERNSILLFTIAADQKEIAGGYELLLKELREYNPELMVKDRVLAITKSDMLDEQLTAEIEATLPADIPHVFISSFTQEGINTLKDILWKSLQSSQL